MKLGIKIGFLALCLSQAAFANCTKDVGQMEKQINTYGSISTSGCPFNSMGWGINKVEAVQEHGSSCSATCKYAKSTGSQGVKCDWAKGNWGNTLSCFYPTARISLK